MQKITSKKSPALLLFVALITLQLACSPVVGQDINLTDEQISQLRALSPTQRLLLLNNLDLENANESSTIDSVPVQTVIEVAPRSPQDSSPSTIEQATIIERGQENSDSPSNVNAQPPEQALQQFGYNLFAGSPSTFAPATDIPVPANYIMGPGDTVILQLYGQQNVTHSLVITREGMLLFPDIGPIAVAGLSFDELRAQVNEIVATQLIGQRAAITLGSLRSIRVFILGEAFTPGSYTVSALSTMTNALFVSGGITNVGSLRNVQLRRQGQTVSELDLYDLLLRGDTSGDVRLQPDDVLFIPPIGVTVGVSGEVIRPAIYELKDETSADEVIALAGGLLPTAFAPATKIERIDASGQRTVIDIDLSADSGLQTTMRNGDRLKVNPVLDRLQNVVLTEGHLQRPGGYQWREGLRVSAVIPGTAMLQPNPDLQYALIVREQQPSRLSEVHKLELGNAINNPGSAADQLLQPNDRIVTFGVTESRGQNLFGLLQELNAQASFNSPAAVVTISGNVRFPGEYPYLQNMTVADMLNSAGGMLENSDNQYALLVLKNDNQGAIGIENAIGPSMSIDGTKAVRKGDRLLIFAANGARTEILNDVISQLKAQSDAVERSRVVRISGQVRFPGEYPLYDGMTVSDLLLAAGGVTESALIEEAELTRYYVEGNAGRQVNHLPINLQESGALGAELRLAEFDNLVVKQLPNWTEAETITITGEVRSPGTYSIAKGDTLSSVLLRAGGLTSYADSNASVLLREALREQERELLEQYRQDLEGDIAAIALEEENNEEQSGVLSVGNNLLSQVDETEPLGRLVVDLPKLLAGALDADVIVRDGDQLFIPRTRQEVSIMGEVNYPTSYLYNPKTSVADYINLSGGFTQRSDAKRTYIIKANGQVVSFNDSRWFFQQATALEAGDTIVVPFDVEPVDYLATWTSVSQVLFNLATSVLAINSVQN